MKSDRTCILMCRRAHAKFKGRSKAKKKLKWHFRVIPTTSSDFNTHFWWETPDSPQDSQELEPIKLPVNHHAFLTCSMTRNNPGKILRVILQWNSESWGHKKPWLCETFHGVLVLIRAQFVGNTRCTSVHATSAFQKSWNFLLAKGVSATRGQVSWGGGGAVKRRSPARHLALSHLSLPAAAPQRRWKNRAAVR